MGNVTQRQTSETQPRPAPQPEQEEDEAMAGWRIRWERDLANPDRILIFDASTGEIIGIVRSLFDPWAV